MKVKKVKEPLLLLKSKNKEIKFDGPFFPEEIKELNNLYYEGFLDNNVVWLGNAMTGLESIGLLLSHSSIFLYSTKGDKINRYIIKRPYKKEEENSCRSDFLKENFSWRYVLHCKTEKGETVFLFPDREEDENLSISIYTKGEVTQKEIIAYIERIQSGMLKDKTSYLEHIIGCTRRMLPGMRGEAEEKGLNIKCLEQ